MTDELLLRLATAARAHASNNAKYLIRAREILAESDKQEAVDAEPVAWRIFDGEGNYDYTDTPPSDSSVHHASMYGRKFEPLYAHPIASADVQDRINAAVERFDDYMALIGGCTDGGCVIVKPKGMHTNGGCRCPKDPQKMQRAMFAAINLRNAIAANRASTDTKEK